MKLAGLTIAIIAALGAASVFALGPGERQTIDCYPERLTVTKLTRYKVEVKCSGVPYTTTATATETPIPPTSTPIPTNTPEPTPTGTVYPLPTPGAGCGVQTWTTAADFAGGLFNNTEVVDWGVDQAVAVTKRPDGTYDARGGWGYATPIFGVPSGNYMLSIHYQTDTAAGGVLIPQARFSRDNVTWTDWRAYYDPSPATITLWPAEHFHFVQWSFFLLAADASGQSYVETGGVATPYLLDFSVQWCAH